ncbi:hypothetical protein [Pseudonocardia aurantiaca]|uniref:hypothetical protein n=1 Tax=Pseudonocardia aurantiaca TaxID=75290 RepID=UPI0031DF198B
MPAEADPAPDPAADPADRPAVGGAGRTVLPWGSPRRLLTPGRHAAAARNGAVGAGVDVRDGADARDRLLAMLLPDPERALAMVADAETGPRRRAEAAGWTRPWRSSWRRASAGSRCWLDLP